MITASLRNYRQSPRKVRLVANMIRGKKVDEAISVLSFTAKRSTVPLKKLVMSAVANAKNNFKIDSTDLVIEKIEVNQGLVYKRSQPMARGTAFPIRKKCSHVTITLAPKTIPAKSAKKK